MDPKERMLLEAFDQSGYGGAALALESLGDAEQWRPVANDLVARGWLRPSAKLGRYERTEDGRLALAKPLDVTVYTRNGCHLCEEAKAQIAPLLRDMGARVREVNIDEDPALRALYDYDVPVIFIGARKVAKHRVDLKQFRRQLADALRAGQAD